MFITKNRFSMQIVSQIIAMVLVVLLLVSCGGKAPAGGDKAVDQEKPEEAVDQEKPNEQLNRMNSKMRIRMDKKKRNRNRRRMWTQIHLVRPLMQQNHSVLISRQKVRWSLDFLMPCQIIPVPSCTQ